MNTILQKSYLADAAIPPFRIVKLGTADDRIAVATGVGDLSFGVTNEVGPAANERADVLVYGIAFVEASAAIAKGSKLTSDAVGRAAVAAPAAGANNQIIGIALETAAATGDVIRVLLTQSVMQG